jgi:hypothetical protein
MERGKTSTGFGLDSTKKMTPIWVGYCWATWGKHVGPSGRAEREEEGRRLGYQCWAMQEEESRLGWAER